MAILSYVGWGALASAAFIAAVNFYCSFLHFPLYKLLGREYHRNSGWSAIGSISLVVSIIALDAAPELLAAALLVALFNTGGLPWFAAILLWHSVRRGG